MAVTIYTTPSCGYCKVAKEFFRTQHVSFTEYNVASDQRKADEMVRKSGQMGVPVIPKTQPFYGMIIKGPFSEIG